MYLWSSLATAACYSSGIPLSFRPTDASRPFKRRRYSYVVTSLVCITLVCNAYNLVVAYMDESNTFLYSRRRTKGLFDTPLFYGLTHVFVFLSAVVSLISFNTTDTLALLNHSANLCGVHIEKPHFSQLNKYLPYAAFAIPISVTCVESFLTLSSSWSKSWTWAAAVALLTVTTRLPAFTALSLFYILLLSVAYKLRRMQTDLLETCAEDKVPYAEQRFRKPAVLLAELKELRMLHMKLSNFSHTIMDRFQYDIMFLILYAFYSCITSTYNVVTNLQYAFNDTASTTIFVFLNTAVILGNTVLLIISCRGPSVVSSELAVFHPLVSMVKNKSENILDTRYQNEFPVIAYISSSIASGFRKTLEPLYNLVAAGIKVQVRYLFLQCQVTRRNHFIVAGMFELNNAFLFTMSTTIVSYVIVLVQFAE